MFKKLDLEDYVIIGACILLGFIVTSLIYYVGEQMDNTHEIKLAEISLLEKGCQTKLKQTTEYTELYMGDKK